MSENLVDRFASCGLSWEVAEPAKWVFFSSFLESINPPQIWGVKIKKGSAVILELECSKDPRKNNKLVVEMKDHRTPIFVGEIASKVAVTRSVLISTEFLSKQQRAMLFDALGIISEEEEPLAQKLIKPPTPSWVQGGSQCGCYGSEWVGSIALDEPTAKTAVENFLRALPKELLPSWAQPPKE